MQSDGARAGCARSGTSRLLVLITEARGKANNMYCEPLHTSAQRLPHDAAEARARLASMADLTRVTMSTSIAMTWTVWKLEARGPHTNSSASSFVESPRCERLLPTLRPRVLPRGSCCAGPDGRWLSRVPSVIRTLRTFQRLLVVLVVPAGPLCQVHRPHHPDHHQ